MELENRIFITENASHDLKFNWIIPNVKTIPGSRLSFPLQTSDKCNLKLEIILKLASGSAKKLKIGLSKTQLESRDFNVFFYFEICNFHGEVFCKDSLEFLFSRNERDVFSREVTRPTAAASEPNNARHLHYVSVRGHIVVKQWCETVETESESNETVIQLQQDFKEILQSGEAADVTIYAGNEQFRAHKFILYARSPVFRKMFTNDMIESRQNTIRIDDVNSAVLKDLLTFLYTGEIGTPTFDQACELYSVGNKYEVRTLQKSCRSILISYLSDNTVSGILKLADMHNDPLLEDKAVKFISEHFAIVAENSDWKALIFDSPLLVSRTLQTVSNDLSILK